MAFLGKRGGLLILVALGSLAAARSAGAQESMPPMAGSGPGKFQVKSMTFKLPFKVDPRTLASVQEMHLWGCDDKGVWLIMDRVSPVAGFFTCRVGQDGEYGFSIVTVDRQGKVQPADVTRRPPELLVVVNSASEAPALAPLVTDVAPGKMPAITEPQSPPAPLPSVPAIDKKKVAAVKTETSAPAGPSIIKTSTSETVETGSEAPFTMTEIEHGGPAASEAEAPPAMDPPAGPAPVSTSTTILINSTQVSVDYNVNRKGPSGISKVEIYGTTDGGRTWKRFGEDADRMSPADVTLPGEGTFGLRLVGINGNGFGKPPAPGTQPTTSIEVDCTRPKIQAWKVAPIKNGKLEIQWLVLDKNLGNGPVNLYYGHERCGPWKPLCKRLKGEGVFRGPLPSDAADQLTIRIEAVDLAGNTSICETQEPVIIDRVEPDINVVGITVTPRSAAGGNVVPASGTVKDRE